MDRRRFFRSSAHTALGLAGGVGLAHSAATAAEHPAPRSRRPNIILIMTDDQGYADLGCHGNPVIKTPNLDNLAGQSVECTQFYVCPVCAPTRASLMTGRYNYRTGVVDTYLGRAMMHTDEVTIAEVLGRAGYRTGIFGKWHLGDNYPLRPIDQGFEESLVHRGGGIGQPSDPPGGESYFDPILTHNGHLRKYEGYCTDVFTDAAIRFVEQNRERPFFVYLATNAPHTPLQIADKYVEPFREMGINENLAKIYGMIANIDDNVGHLLERLETLDLQDDTIVVFLTDNGPGGPRGREFYNAGLRGRKGTVYEGGIRVPFFIRWPGKLEAGRKIRRIAAHIDVMPTLLTACGVAPPEDVRVDGKDLLPLLRGRDVEWPDRTLFFQWHRGDEPEPFRASAARSQRYKLVNGKELYDMLADPGEENDIADQHPEIVAKLRREYEAWFQDVSSTRGYAPPRIYIGSPHENPVTLTRQDWRGPRAGWRPDSLGYWEVKVARDGRYDVTLLFAETKSEGEARFKLRDVTLDKSLEKGVTGCTFAGVNLEAGEGRLEAWIKTGEKPAGVKYVELKRLP